MQKHIYLIKGNKNEPYNEFITRIFSYSEDLISDGQLFSIKVVLTEHAPPKITVIPFKKAKIACISIVSNDLEYMDQLQKWDGFEAGFLAEEALPVAYEKTWNDGEKTPGICLLTLFKKKQGLDYDKFIKRWHQGHTPLSLEIHPLWHYNRNVIKEKMAGHNNIHWDGIVEEHTRSRSELINPFKFFGRPHKVFHNMYRVYTDTRSFLDYKTIEPYFCSEYHMKS